jgi:hypothetical protein
MFLYFLIMLTSFSANIVLERSLAFHLKGEAKELSFIIGIPAEEVQ